MSMISTKKQNAMLANAGLTTSTAPCLRSNGEELVARARETRRSAEAFAATVRRYSAEMPSHLDRFHEAMNAFRETANTLYRTHRLA